MSEKKGPVGGAATPRDVIGQAIQDLMAARLARGFVPVAGLFAFGAVRFVSGSDIWLAIGAVLTAGAMLGYGLRIVQNAFGRPKRLWMSLAMVGSVVPPVFSLYVIGWEGLRRLGPGAGLAGVAVAIILVGAGVWVLRCWMKVVEVERLARVMAVNMDEEGGPA